MNHIPILVIERIAVFTDSDSLVLLSCCSKWLRYCISQQNNLWHQQYKQYYNLADNSEIKWLVWYVQTTRASKPLAQHTKNAIGIAQLNNQYIEWFCAFCYRRATDANWLKDTTYPIKDLVGGKTDNIRSIVLQRIAYRHTDLRKCFIAEQCQSVEDISAKRFWRLRKLFSNDADYKYHVQQCLISDKFVVAISTQTNNPGYFKVKPSIISIWPVSRVSIMRPRQFSCLCNNANIRGRWMTVTHFEVAAEKIDRTILLERTHVFDLAYGQKCMGTITTYKGKVFLLRVTEEAAVAFSRTLHHSDTTITFKWNVWKFSNRHLEDNPRCLIQGEIHFKRSKSAGIFVKKLDDTRVLIENNSLFAANQMNENTADDIKLAMISTECGYSNVCIKDAKPIWTRNDDIYSTVPLFGSNRILVISERGWTVHSIIDGAILAHINVENLDLVFETPRLLHIADYTKLFISHIGRFVLYRSKYDNKFIAVDLMNLRTRNLGIANSEYLYETCERRGIIVKFSSLIRQPLLLNDTFDTRNAALIEDDENYRVIDLSF
ncbi:hypothetical protein BDF19DRAFT_246684 [Syncephalis fuscata]|nr:hypothetical protein BDF19DRAFT_246684 [Syncephalis fuscata]